LLKHFFSHVALIGCLSCPAVSAADSFQNSLAALVDTFSASAYNRCYAAATSDGVWDGSGLEDSDSLAGYQVEPVLTDLPGSVKARIFMRHSLPDNGGLNCQVTLEIVDKEGALSKDFKSEVEQRLRRRFDEWLAPLSLSETLIDVTDCREDGSKEMLLLTRDPSAMNHTYSVTANFYGSQGASLSGGYFTTSTFDFGAKACN